MSTTRFIHKNEFEAHSNEVLKDIGETGDTCYITEEGRAKAVLMDINRYNALMDIVEDAEAPAAGSDDNADRKEVTVRGILKSSTTRIFRKKPSAPPSQPPTKPN